MCLQIFLKQLHPNGSYQWAYTGQQTDPQQMHENSDSFSGTSQDADVNTTECSHLTLKLSRPDLSDTSSNSNDGQADANVSTNDCGGGDNMTMISVRYHYTPHLVVNNLKTDKCLFLRTYFSIILCATLYEEITTETNRQVSEKISEAVPLTNT